MHMVIQISWLPFIVEHAIYTSSLSQEIDCKDFLKTYKGKAKRKAFANFSTDYR